MPSRESKSDRFLDAARQEFIDHGISRVGVAEIARRAGVSRQTLYRTCGDKDAIVSAVVAREVLGFVSTFAKDIAVLPTPQERLIEAFVVGMRECRDNPIVNALRHFDLDFLVAQLLDSDNDGRRSARMAMAMLVAGGDIPFETAERIVEFAVRVTATLLVSPTALLPTDTDTGSREFAQNYLAAAVTSVLSSSLQD